MDHTVRVFQVEGKIERWKWEAANPVRQLGFSPSGKTVALLTYPAPTYRADTPPPKAELALLEGENGQVRMREPLAESKYSFTGWMSFVAEGKLLVFDSAGQKLSSEKVRIPTLLAFEADRGERLAEISFPHPHNNGMWGEPAAVSPDGRLVAILHPHGSSHVELRPLAGGTGTQIPLNGGQAFGFTFTLDSKRLAYFTSELNLDLDDLKLHDSLPTFGPLFALAGKSQPYLLQAHVVDVPTGKELATFLGYSGRSGRLRFSPDGKTLMAFGGNYPEKYPTPMEAAGEVVLWNVEERATARMLSANTKALHDLAVSPDGKRLVTVGEDKVVRVWDAASGALAHELTGHQSPTPCLSLGNDPHQILVPSGQSVVLWNMETGKLLRTYAEEQNGPSWSVRCAAMRPDGKQIALSDIAGKIVLIDAESGKREFEIDKVGSHLRYSLDGKLLAIPYQFDLHGELKIVDTASGKVRHHFRTEPKMEFFRTGWGYLRATFSPDGRYVAAVGNVGGAHLYDLRSGKLLHKMQGHGTTVWDAAFTSDGSRLATSGYSDGTVKLWSVATGEEVHTLRGHEGHVTGVAFSPDDSRLFSADTSGVVRIWEAR